MNNLRFSSLLFFGKPAKPIVRKPAVRTLPLRVRKPVPAPFSWPGIVAVLACPVIFLLDIFSSSQVFIGVLYLVMLTFLMNERRTLVVLFSTIASLMIAIDLRLVYGQTGTDMVMMDKVVGLIAIWSITGGVLRARVLQAKAKRKRKPACSIRLTTPLPNCLATPDEIKAAVRHLRTASKRPVDPYTLELIQFIYTKSSKN